MANRFVETGRKCVFLVVVALLLAACTGNGTQGDGLMSSSGRSSEVLVVCPDKDWNGSLGDSLREVLEAPVAGLPRTEPMFRVSQVNPEHFTPMYQKQRNILVLQVRADATASRLLVERDKWARPQTVLSLSSPRADSLAVAFSCVQERIVQHIMQGEMRRFQRAQRAQEDASLNRRLQERYALSMVLPEGFFFAVCRPDFCWLRKETKYWGQSVMVYTEPYTSESQFSPEHIAALRNRLTHAYVQGSSEGSYASIDDRFYPVLYRNFAFPNSPYAVEARGLWGLFGHPGDHMGGAFVSYTFLDTVYQRVVTADAFLYAPSDEKRDLLRQEEAILLTLQAVDTLSAAKK
ncbi:MAG: DUF4837 family protein [Bacteroidales bacterium]|nr:DUF4837 family protein [Bacteroidales bacterium]